MLKSNVTNSCTIKHSNFGNISIYPKIQYPTHTSPHDFFRTILNIMYEDNESENDVEMRLWNIFTYYTSRGNSQDPQHLRAETFYKLCEECGIVDNVRVLKQDCYVVYRSLVAKRADKHTGRGSSLGGKYGKLSISEKAHNLQVRHDPGVKHSAVKKMHFSDFLSGLSELGKKLFGENNDEQEDINNFERIIMEYVIPNAHHRVAVPVPLDECDDLYRKFSPAFKGILQYYGEFVGTEEKEDEQKRSSGRLAINIGMNSMSSNLSYPKWLQFCDDFNLRSSMSNTPILTSVELAEIFLQSINARTIDYLGKLNFEEFWEAIVRCAQVAYRNIDTNMENKLKELFINMSHKIDQSVSKSVNFTGHRDVSTNGAMIIDGMKKFQMALNILFRHDGMPQSYLTRREKKRLNGRALLGSLLGRHQKQREKQMMLEQSRREEEELIMLAEQDAAAEYDEDDIDRSASSAAMGMQYNRRHVRNRSMENRNAALAGLLHGPSTTSKKQTNLLEDDEFRPDALGKEDRRPPPSTPQVPRSNNRSVSGKDRSYRGLLQQKEKRKLRALVRHCLVNRSSV